MENNNWNKMKDLAPIVLRWGMALVFLWFGAQQILNAGAWTGLMPAWIVSASGLKATTLVHLNGSFEVVFGLSLLLGYFTRLTAFLLAFHMLDIVLTVGYSPIGVRDFGLLIGTLVICLHGMDAWSLDYLLGKKAENVI